MQLSDIPDSFKRIWASGASGTYKRAIPELASGLPTGQASLELGFPAACFTDIGAGGVPPDGRDFNGIYEAITAWCQWLSAGVPAQYNSAFSTAIGGYPKYTILASTTTGVLWQSTAENNTTDPDSGGAANWISVIPAGLTVAGGADYVAGTDNAKFLSSKAAADGANSVDTETLVFPGGRLYKSNVQYGTFTAENQYTITFATPFPNTCRVALPHAINGTGSIARDNWAQLISFNQSSFTFMIQRSNAGSDNNMSGVAWTADGS